MSDGLKQLILEKRGEGKLVYSLDDGFESVDIDEFISQPVDGILYDLNRLEEVVLTYIDDPKWVNDFAVALTIRALKKEISSLEFLADKLKDRSNILSCLEEAGIDNVEAYSQGMHLYFERYPEKDEEL